jgi:hypothetical protein
MAVDQYALTTLQRLKDWLGVTTSTNDTLYERSIDAASARIERFIGREIVARDRIEFRDPQRSDTLVLKQYPVISCRFIGYGAKTALTVSANPQAADLSGTVQVTDSAIVTVRNTAGGVTNTTLTYDFATPTYTTAEQVQPLINAATGFLCTLDWNAPLRYMHRMGPIDVTDNPAHLTAPDIRATDFIIDLPRGIVHLGASYRSVQWPTDWHGTFGASPQTVVIDYRAGYETVPYDIEETCWMVAAQLFRNRQRDMGVNSESLGDYSYVNRGPSTIDEILEEHLSQWRAIR